MSLNILVVDDSDVIRSMIMRTLSLAEIPIGTVFEASNGREALDVLDESWVDLVLADINMPVMNGEEMLKTMQSRPEMADTPVIVVSTEGATERVDQMLAGGVSAWVRKPFTPEQIRDVILSVTESWPPLEERNAHLDKVIGSVLETFAFVSPEPIDGEQASLPAGDLMCASITFSGATSGAMVVYAPQSLCVEMAANILGIEGDEEDAHFKGADTLGEVVNIAAGHVATLIEPHRQTDLHPPVVSRVDPSFWDSVVETGARAYSVDGVPILVSLGLRPQKTA